MATVWRVQGERGVGPYHSPHEWQSVVPTTMQAFVPDGEYDRHPTPYRDGLEDVMGIGRIFGFRSREAMHRWFDGYWEGLAYYGYRPTRWEVDDDQLWLGRDEQVGQVVFDRRFATLVETGVGV